MISFLQGSTRCREHQTRVGMAQSVEHIVHIDGVVGSSPTVTTQKAGSPLRWSCFFISSQFIFSEYESGHLQYQQHLLRYYHAQCQSNEMVSLVLFKQPVTYGFNFIGIVKARHVFAHSAV